MGYIDAAALKTRAGMIGKTELGRILFAMSEGGVAQ
jgi:hypothetical protein